MKNKTVYVPRWARMGDHGWRSWTPIIKLRIRAANVLSNAGVDPDDNAAVKSALLSGVVVPGKTRNYGWGIHAYLCREFGLQMQKRPRTLLVCPHCKHKGAFGTFERVKVMA